MAYDNSDGRLRGRKLQETRRRIWAANPYCAMCGKLTTLEYPHRDAFELDHKQAVTDGGTNDDDNLQVLCCGADGCHGKKTAKDMGYKIRPQIGLDGYPV